MPIAELGKPKALDSLVVDGVLYPLTYQRKALGYLRDGTFIPVREDQLRKSKTQRGGSPTWTIKPAGRERVELPATDAKAGVILSRFRVDMSFNKESAPTRVVRASDEVKARNKAIKAFAFTAHQPYQQAFAYFHANPESIKVTKL